MLVLILISSAFGMIYPSQVHLSWTENADTMRVTWFSHLFSNGRIAYKPIFCTQKTEWTVIDATVERIDFGENKSRYGYIYTGVIEDIISDCYYEYSVATGQLWSYPYMFEGRTPGTDDFLPFNLIVFGDLGTQEYGTRTYQLMEKIADTEDILGIFHMGDIGYNLDSLDGQIGDDFLNMVEPLASTIPYMTIPGNHDLEKNYTHYTSRFKMPVNKDNNGKSLFYSLDIGYMHIVMVNSVPFLEVEKYDERAVMINWLKEDLDIAVSKRRTTPWIVVMMHHVLYCCHDHSNIDSVQDCEAQSAIVRYAFEDIFNEYKVDLVIQGHIHHYERTSSMYKNKTVQSDIDTENSHTNAKAPVYIISGAGGNRLGKNDIASPKYCEWSRKKSNDFGFGVLRVEDKETLLWEQYSSEGEREIDHLYLYKKNNR